MKCPGQNRSSRRGCHLRVFWFSKHVGTGWRFDGGAGRQGFTLLETVIAMTLVSVLMLLVWSIFGIYTKLESKGVIVAREISLLRAIHRQMRDDLLRIVPIDPGRDPALISEMALESAASTPALPNGFFLGTASEIHFAVFDRPAGSKRLMSRIVSYQAPPLRSESLLGQQSDADDSEPRSLPVDSLGMEPFSAGIERHVQSWSQYLHHRTQNVSLGDELAGVTPSTLDVDDLLVIGPPDEITDSATDEEGETPEIIDPVPEIGRHQFRFFDGTAWMDQWDSAFTGSLPMAIRFELDVDDQQDDLMEEPLEEAELVEDGSLAGGVEDPDREFIDLDADDLGLEAESQLEYRWVIAIDAAMRPAAPSTDSPIDNEEVFP